MSLRARPGRGSHFHCPELESPEQEFMGAGGGATPTKESSLGEKKHFY